jgi:hypothetical protein
MCITVIEARYYILETEAIGCSFLTICIHISLSSIIAFELPLK